MVRGREWTGFEAVALQEAMRKSVREFAALLGVEQTTISNWRAGLSGVKPRPASQAILDTTYELRATPEDRARFEQIVGEGEEVWRERHKDGRRRARPLLAPVDILVEEPNEEEDVKRRQFFGASAIGAGVVAGVSNHDTIGRDIGATEVNVGAKQVVEIKAGIEQILDLDKSVGGNQLCHLAAGYVRYVKYLLDAGCYTDAVGRALTIAGAEMMTAAGWVHFDAGRRDAARQYYAEAIEAATVVDDGIAAARAFSNASCLLWDRFDDDRRANPYAVQFAHAASQAASRQGGPKLRALTAVREAAAHGSRADTTEMTRALSRAYREYESNQGHDPDWMYLTDHELVGVTGIARMHAGEHARATSNLQSAIDGFSGCPRVQASYQLYLAHNLIRAGDAAHACHGLSTNFHSINGMASTRLQTRLKSIVRGVRPYSTVPEVRDFLEMTGEVS